MSGRAINVKRTGKKPLMVRADELLSEDFSNLIAQGLTGNLYNFEYFMNRAYAFNRDKGRCRISGKELSPHDINIHHINPNLLLDKVNKVSNLATVHKDFHYLIHNQTDCSHLNVKIRNKVQGFRNKLVTNTTT
jgi:predicted MarR family transcription regulator